MSNLRALPYYQYKKNIMQDSRSTDNVENVNDNFDERNEMLEEFMERAKEKENDK